MSSSGLKQLVCHKLSHIKLQLPRWLGSAQKQHGWTSLQLSSQAMAALLGIILPCFASATPLVKCRVWLRLGKIMTNFRANCVAWNQGQKTVQMSQLIKQFIYHIFSISPSIYTVQGSHCKRCYPSKHTPNGFRQFVVTIQQHYDLSNAKTSGQFFELLYLQYLFYNLFHVGRMSGCQVI